MIFVNSVYKIGILGPPKSHSNPTVYTIDPIKRPDRERSSREQNRVIISKDMFEDRIPGAFKNKNKDSYALLDHVAYKQQKDIFLLQKTVLTNLRSATQSGGKKTKKVHPAKKNITRSKRR